MKTKLLLSNLKDLIFLANNQLAEGHAEASAMVIKHAIDKFADIEHSLAEVQLELESLRDARTAVAEKDKVNPEQ